MFDAPVIAPSRAGPLARLVGGATTPALLRRAMAAIAVLCVLAAGLSVWAALSIGQTAQTVGRDAEPSVALALRMAATLADMNAAALADSLTDGGAATGTSARFRQDQIDLGADTVAAARNITYGEAEAAPLRGLQRWVLAYQEAIAEARSLGQGDPWTTARRVQWASRVNRDFAAPEAVALAAANADVLEARYAAYRAGSLALGGAAIAAFLLLLLALIGLQFWLAQRMRRIVNPLLAAATAVAAAGMFWFGTAVLTEREDLRAAKSDAYNSLRVLFEAKGAVNQVRADQSMWLLDPPTRAESQARIDASLHALVGADLGAPATVRQLRQAFDQALALEREGKAREALAAVSHFDGLLGTEFDNITFGMAERQPATDSVNRLVEAGATVRTVQAEAVQQEARARNHVVAVQHWLSVEPGGGGGAFAAVQSALDRTIAVNQLEFDRRVTASLATVAWMPWITTGALALTALLAVGGLWQRLREYR